MIQLIGWWRTAAYIADVIPVFGFYLQPAVGGILLDYEFWRQFLEIPNVVAIKVAPFNRYQTLDVVRALADSGRQDDVAFIRATTTTSSRICSQRFALER